jgi:inorganic pyrophosphatase
MENPRFTEIETVIKKLPNSNINMVFLEYRPVKWMFGVKNYGEIRNIKNINETYINKADGDPFDVFVPGYNRKLKLDTSYKVKNILGIFWLKNGNHKIAVGLYVPGFDYNTAIQQIKSYCTKYSTTLKKEGWWIPFDEKYSY